MRADAGVQAPCEIQEDKSAELIMNIAQTIPVADGWSMHGGDIGAGWIIVMGTMMVLFMGAMMWMMMRGMGRDRSQEPLRALSSLSDRIERARLLPAPRSRRDDVKFGKLVYVRNASLTAARRIDACTRHFVVDYAEDCFVFATATRCRRRWEPRWSAA